MKLKDELHGQGEWVNREFTEIKKCKECRAPSVGGGSQEIVRKAETLRAWEEPRKIGPWLLSVQKLVSSFFFWYAFGADLASPWIHLSGRWAPNFFPSRVLAGFFFPSPGSCLSRACFEISYLLKVWPNLYWPVIDILSLSLVWLALRIYTGKPLSHLTRQWPQIQENIPGAKQI
jgi:hypothetical protein